LSLAARTKIQLLGELLVRSSHEVEILSQGDVEDHRLKFFPAFEEPERFHPNIPIFYSSAFAARYVTGFWESTAMQRLLNARHRARPYDLVLIYNMKRAQIGCAHYARRRGVPVILEYEDDSFVNVHGHAAGGVISRYHRQACAKVLKFVAGGTGVSPYLQSQFPPATPTILLRGVVSAEILRITAAGAREKPKRVVFSGTHEGTQGLEQMIKAWGLLKVPGWELHIAGKGPITQTLERLAEDDRSIVFHGLLDRRQNAELICSARIGMNPQDVTVTPGNVFPFKIIEYLAAGAHVLTTRRGPLEPELEAGVTYIPDNTPDAITAGLKHILTGARYELTAQEAAVDRYGPEATSRSLARLISEVLARQAQAATLQTARQMENHG
jgi:glycosyltransferase involved in cell wall biosynthesis